MQNKKGFRMWKSGKTWLFAAGVVLTLTGATYHQYTVLAQENETSIVQNSQTPESEIVNGIDQLHPAIEDEEYNQQLKEDNSNIPSTSRMARSAVVFNGSVGDNKASVSRTSTGFTATNVSDEVKSVKVAWITDTSKITVNVHNAFYIKAPFSFDVELNKPLAKGESVTVPLRIDGQIFNSNSKSSVRKATQNNGNYYVSQDKNYSYDYDSDKQEVTITALTDASFTTFKNMTYFLNNDWVPVPLRETPYPLSGGVKGNYGAKGSGGTITVSLGDNTTSESVTNTQDIAFSEDIVKYNHSMIESNSQDIITNSTAASSNNFLGASSTVIAQSNKGNQQDLLDGSMDHYTIKPLTNSKANKSGETDPYSLIRTEFYMPIGSSSANSNVKAIAGGFTVDKLPPLKNVFKNAKYNKDTGILEFDLSRSASDWGKLADEMLTTPEYSNYLKTEWIKTYLQSMSGSNANHNTLYVNLYEVSPQAYSPINYNLPLKTDIIVKNTKSNQTRTQHITVNPVSAGDGLATQAGITALYVDENTGEPIGKSSETKFFEPATGYTFNPPGIAGYKYVAKNDPKIIEKLGATDIVDDKGKVTTNMVGKQSYIIYSYTKGGTIVTSYKDTVEKKLKPSVINQGNDGDVVNTKAEDIKNYYVKELKKPEDAAKAKLQGSARMKRSLAALPASNDSLVPHEYSLKIQAGEELNVDYIYDNKAPVTYSVVDSTDNVEKVTDADFATGIMGETFANDTNKEKLDNIVKDWESKGYKLEFIDNGQLPDVTDENGYNIKIHLSHNTHTKIVPGPDAVKKIDNVSSKHTIIYKGLPDAKKLDNNVQQFNFTATVEQTIDSVTGEILSEAEPVWSEEQHSQEIESPKVDGYTPDKEKTDSLTINHSSKDSEEVVTYKAIDIPITYSVIDDEIKNGENILEDKSSFSTAQFDTDFNTEENSKKLSDILKSYTDKGYEVVSVSNKDLPNPETIKGYDIEIHLKHGTHTKIVPGTDAKNKIDNISVKHTVIYKGLPDSKKLDDNIQELTFTSTVEQTIDSVTGEILSEAEPVWSKEQSTKAIESPKVDGYTPDKKTTDSIKIEHTSKDSEEIVTYKANDIPITYSVIDDESKEENKTLENKVNFGTAQLDTDFNTEENSKKLSDILSSYTDKGYEVVSVSNKDLPIPETTQGYDIEIHLKHTYSKRVVPGTSEEVKNKVDDKNVTQTIQYVGMSDDKKPKDNIQKFTFTATVEQTIDDVTKEVIQEAEPIWSLKDKESNSKDKVSVLSEAVESPNIAGYLTETKEVKGVEYTPESKDNVITVEYKEVEKPVVPESPKVDKQTPVADVKKPDIKTGVTAKKSALTIMITALTVIILGAIGLLVKKRK